MDYREATYARRVEDYTAGKTEVSGIWFWGFALLAVSIAAINAFMNAVYGFQSGTGWIQSLLIGAAFLLLDLALIALAYRYFPGWITGIMAVVSLIGLVPMSMFAATSFMVGQQHEKDAIVVETQSELVKGLQARVNATDPAASPINYRDASRELSRETDKLNRIIERNGGYVSGSSAVYHYLAKTTDSTVEKVTLIIRAIWSVVFVFVSVTLGGMLNQNYTVGTLMAYARRMQSKDVSDARAKRDYLVAMADAPALLENEPEEDESIYPVRTGHVPSKEKSTTYPARTQVRTGHEPRDWLELYEAAKQGIEDRVIAPSVQGLKDSGLGIGTDNARRMLKELRGDRVIKNKAKGQGYELA